MRPLRWLADLFSSSSNAGVLPLKIVVLGSSTAAGAGVLHGENTWVNRYRAFLQQEYLHQFEVINLAQSGYCSYQMMPSDFVPPPGRPLPDNACNITQALSVRPNAIILNLPSNDTASGHSVAEQLANLDLLVHTAAQANVVAWICTTQPRNFEPEGIQTQQALRDAILEQYGERSINFWEGLATPEGHLIAEFDTGDGAHLNDAGHQLLFERVRDKNIPAVLLTTPSHS